MFTADAEGSPAEAMAGTAEAEDFCASSDSDTGSHSDSGTGEDGDDGSGEEGASLGDCGSGAAPQASGTVKRARPSELQVFMSPDEKLVPHLCASYTVKCATEGAGHKAAMLVLENVREALNSVSVELRAEEGGERAKGRVGGQASGHGGRDSEGRAGGLRGFELQ
jgi:hypothetical protein